jgi:hypothetical protein
MNLDILKPIRETIDWLIEKYKTATDIKTKNQLNEIANEISKISVHKAAYLEVLKREIELGKDFIDLSKARDAISEADKDTNNLSELLKRFDFDSSKIGFSLKHDLEELTRLKQVSLADLKRIYSEDKFTSDTQEKLISELESFKLRWVELGKKIDSYFNK